MSSQSWGCSSDAHRLTDVALRTPEHFRWFGANAVVRENLRKGVEYDPEVALEQHRGFVQAFEEAGVNVHYTDADPLLQYQVYTRDPAMMTPWGMLIGQMYRVQRRGEVVPTQRFCEENGIPVWNWVTAGPLEGGDFHLIKPRVAAIGLSGDRTSPEAAGQVKAWFEAEGWEVRFIPIAEHFLHLDLLFSMISDDLALACVEVLEDEHLDWLRSLGIEIVPTTYKEAMALSGNCLSLGEGRVISAGEAKSVNEKIRAHGIKVLDPDLSMFTQAGGGARCLSQPLRRVG